VRQRYPTLAFTDKMNPSKQPQGPSKEPPHPPTSHQFLNKVQRLQRRSTMASKEKEKEKLEAKEEDIQYVVYVRLPFNRGDFVDPPPVSLRTVLPPSPCRQPSPTLTPPLQGQMGRGQIRAPVGNHLRAKS
jgi:hypothetical protein